MLTPGSVIDERYEIIAPLAEGGMGAVYRARRRLLGDEVAIKVVPPAFTADGRRLAVTKDTGQLAVIDLERDVVVRTIELASYWPDCIKTLGERFSYASPWHYQNVNICQPFDENAACPDGNCVSRQIDRQLRLLADRRVPTRERLMALAFLIHFMGDLHQPMHAGDHNDLGGNRVPVDYGIISGRTNLHLVWDGYLAERGISQPEGDARGILAELSPAERAAMREGDIAAWLREGWAVSREFAYGTIRADPCVASPDTRPVITEEIVRQLIPVVRRQVARGGLRLARLLDEAFQPDSPWGRPAERRRS